MVATLAVAVRARADFVLTGTEHLDVSSAHDVGGMWDTSTADLLYGGRISTTYVNDEANLHITDGWISTLNAYNSSSVDMWGGEVSTSYLYGEAWLRLAYGDVSQLTARDHSRFGVYGNVVTLNAYDSSRGDINRRSDVSTLYAHGEARLRVLDGKVSTLEAGDSSSAHLWGGEVLNLSAEGASSVTIHGYDFHVSGGLTWNGDELLGSGVLTGKWAGADEWWITTIQTNAPGASLRAMVLVPGDATGDGVVDDIDLTVLAEHWQQSGGWLKGDFNGDGFVDDLDLTVLATAWPTGSVTGVPEPGTLSLLALAGLAWVRRKWNCTPRQRAGPRMPDRSQSRQEPPGLPRCTPAGCPIRSGLNCAKREAFRQPPAPASPGRKNAC